jgi:enamine deaminase RidA (YjgF/YER057c/UK114 family)
VTRWLLLLVCAGIALAEKKAIRPPASATSGPYSAGVLTDKFLYVSGHVGPEPSGGFAPGDVKTQTRRCLELVGKVLKEAGLDYGNVVSTTLYLADIRTLDAADEAYRTVFTSRYPARTEIESQLLIPEALVEVSAVAVRSDPRSIIYLSPKGWALPKRPISHGVSAGGTLFFSALRPVNPATGALAGNTIEEQTAQVMRNQEDLLAPAGMTFGDLAASRIYLTDSSYYAGLNEAYKKFVTAPPPARATINAAPVEPGHLLQIQSVAVKGSAKDRPSGEGITSPIHSYSVKTGDTLYVTGMTGRAPDGSYARNDIKAQTRQALRTIEEQLKRHDMTFADAVDAVVWLRDPRHAAAMNEVYREIVNPNPPSRATVRLSPNTADGLIEIMMIAKK